MRPRDGAHTRSVPPSASHRVTNTRRAGGEWGPAGRGCGWRAVTASRRRLVAARLGSTRGRSGPLEMDVLGGWRRTPATDRCWRCSRGAIACVAVGASDLRDKSRNAHVSWLFSARSRDRVIRSLGAWPLHLPKYQTIGSADLDRTSRAKMYSFQQLRTCAVTSCGGQEAAPWLRAPLKRDGTVLLYWTTVLVVGPVYNGLAMPHARHRVEVCPVDGGGHRPWRLAADAENAGANHQPTRRVARVAGKC